MGILTPKKFQGLLAKGGVVVGSDESRFIYKAPNTCGNLYIDKERFALFGGHKMTEILWSMVNNARRVGLRIEKGSTVVVVGMAYGSLNYAMPVAEALETYFSCTAIPTRTELDRTDDKKHTIPDKLKNVFDMADTIIFVEDVVNAATTLKQGVALMRKFPGKRYIAISLVDRGHGNTAKSIGLHEYYPFLRKPMTVYSLETQEGVDFLNAGTIDTQLGKGRVFVRVYGKVPYTLEQFISI